MTTCCLRYALDTILSAIHNEGMRTELDRNVVYDMR